ncbi:dTDP-4-dehydrorhamnose reductase [Vibrio sp.]|nr:dTDP-4-dehydrorhamnose reductase [Vibrio sp.]
MIEKKVIVTGVNGQVGQFLVEKLKLRKNIQLYAFNRSDLDITSFNDVMSKVNEINPDYIINAAAYTAVDKAEVDKETCFAINAKGSKNLALAADEVNALLIHISTDYVFDGNKIGEYSELDITNPTSVYGQSKLEGEAWIAESCDQYVIVRTAWVFSEKQNNFVKTMLRLATYHPKLTIIDDQFGGPTYAGDIADTLIKVMDGYQDKKQSGIYHYSGYPYVTWFEFASEIFAHAQSYNVLDSVPEVLPIPTSEYPTPAPRPYNSRLDGSKIEKSFNVKCCDWKLRLDCIKEI